jgi:hypothetical protein
MRQRSPESSPALAFGAAAVTLAMLLGLTVLVGCSGMTSTASIQPSPGSLSFGSQTISFGNVPEGSSKTMTFIVTNTGGVSVTISGLTISTQYFTLTSPTLPLTVGAGQTATMGVTFKPNAAGTFNATATVTSNASASVTDISLTGTGTAAAPYSVNLSWTGSTSPNISGYNIYRAVYTTSCGAFSKINSSLIASTVYADTEVVEGTNYCYATTAVNKSNEESRYSNIVSNVQIPAQ